jgi:hypothetical protein
LKRSRFDEKLGPNCPWISTKIDTRTSARH